MYLPDSYCTDIQGLTNYPKSYRLEVMLDALEKPDPVHKHNRYLFDTLQLLEGGDWNKNPKWSFTDVKQLAKKQLSNTDVDNKLIEKLNEYLQKAANETHGSFVEFQDKAPKPFESLNEFLDWFYYNLPYLTLDLKNESGWRKEASQRINWILNQGAGKVDAETHYVLENYAWNFIFDWFSRSAL